MANDNFLCAIMRSHNTGDIMRYYEQIMRCYVLIMCRHVVAHHTIGGVGEQKKIFQAQKFLLSPPGRALNPHPHTRFFRGFFAVQKFFDYTISLRKSENPILHSKGTSDSFWTHM